MHQQNTDTTHLKFTKMVGLAACFTIVVAIIVTFLFVKSPDLTKQIGINSSSVSKASYEISKCIQISTCSRESADQFLTSETISKERKVQIKKNITVMLPKYSPEMNSVPGYPFEIQSSNPTEKDFSFEINVDNGSLCSWNKETGEVTDHGKTIEGKNDLTVYWSPKREDNLFQNAKINIRVRKNNEKIGKQTIIITSEGNVYKATLK